MPVPPPHFNIKFHGGQISSRVAMCHFIGLDPKTIEWAYIVRAKRRATKNEIADLCTDKPVKWEDRLREIERPDIDGYILLAEPYANEEVLALHLQYVESV
jgi:hypothetical protein